MILSIFFPRNLDFDLVCVCVFSFSTSFFCFYLYYFLSCAFLGGAFLSIISSFLSVEFIFLLSQLLISVATAVNSPLLL